MGNDVRSITISTALSWLMKLLLIGLLPYEIYSGQYVFAGAVIITIIISLLPTIVERNYHIVLPFELDLLITLSLFLHTFLGEELDFYDKIPNWDNWLHLYGTAVVAILAFMIVYALHYTRKLRFTIPFIGFFTVLSALSIGALWELSEFAVDQIFGTNTQKSLEDTMWDIFYDLVGGVIVAILGMAYVRYTRPEERRYINRPLSELLNIKLVGKDTSLDD